MFGDMLAYASEVTAVDVEQLFAPDAFEVKMIAAAVLIVDILIAGACLAVDDIFADHALFDQLVKPAIDSCRSEGGALFSHICTDSLHIDVLVLV